jgi:hypothetical protein
MQLTYQNSSYLSIPIIPNLQITASKLVNLLSGIFDKSLAFLQVLIFVCSETLPSQGFQSTALNYVLKIDTIKEFTNSPKS